MIAIASDHGGLPMKEKIIEHLKENGVEYEDFGTNSMDSCDYPDFVLPAAQAVAEGRCEKGIVICTTGIGASITANKVKGIRCGLCFNTTMARLTREHNDANVLAIAGGMTGPVLAMEMVDTFLTTPFSKAERHVRRINKLMDYDQKR